MVAKRAANEASNAALVDAALLPSWEVSGEGAVKEQGGKEARLRRLKRLLTKAKYNLPEEVGMCFF